MAVHKETNHHSAVTKCSLTVILMGTAVPAIEHYTKCTKFTNTNTQIPRGGLSCMATEGVHLDCSCSNLVYLGVSSRHASVPQDLGTLLLLRINRQIFGGAHGLISPPGGTPSLNQLQTWLPTHQKRLRRQEVVSKKMSGSRLLRRLSCQPLSSLTHTHTHTHTHTTHNTQHTRTHACAHACTHTHIHTHAHTQAHTNTHTHTYKCTYTNTYTHPENPHFQ